MKLLISALVAAQFIVNVAQADTTILFDAEEQCKSRQTTQGIRYIPPCTLPDKALTFSVSDDNSTQSPALAVTFQCESLAPLSLSYEISQDEHVIMTGNLAASKYPEQAQSTFALNESLTDYTFKLTELNGARGFQAMKPNCKVVVAVDSVVENADSMDFITFAELTKINIAIWDVTARALAEKNTRFFKYELSNAKYWLETIDNLLVSESTAVNESLSRSIEQLNTALAACGSNYCYSVSMNAVALLHDSNEQALMSATQFIDNKLETYDVANEEETPEMAAWLQLRTLISDKLTPSESTD